MRAATGVATQLLPLRPDLVLRVAFVGNITLPTEAISRREQALDSVLAALTQQMAALTPPPGDVAAAKRLTDYYAPTPPLLRLVTGLAEGGDAEAAAALYRLPPGPVRTELAAVLGCNVLDYRASRADPQYQPVFDELVQKCAYVLTLDGIYQPGPAGAAHRKRLYRAQAAFLLRQADLLIAMADPQKDAKPGGTIETLRQALLFGLPALFIHIGTGHITYLAPGADPLPLLEEDLLDIGTTVASTDWQTSLAAWVAATLDSPDGYFDKEASTELTQSTATAEAHVLREYFTATQLPHYFGPFNSGEPTRRRASRLERCWNWWEARFKTATPLWQQGQRWVNAHLNNEPSQPVALPAPRTNTTRYERYRNRAADLSAHYAGRYRGTFVSNYALAVLIASFAASSLLLLSWQTTTPSLGKLVLAVLLEVGKLGCLGVVFYHATQAQKNSWNDRAVDYRYLSERLQALQVLPTLGSFQPPSTVSLRFASRVVRQSAIEWLFKAITRSVPPLALEVPPTLVTIGENELSIRLLPCEAAEGLNKVAGWITREVDYHRENRRKMAHMNSFLRRWGAVAGGAATGLVLVNFVGLLLGLRWEELQHFYGRISHQFASSGTHSTLSSQPYYFREAPSFPAQVEYLAAYNWFLVVAPFLAIASAVLPVLVASMSGIRLQSESHRLAERSGFLLRLLTSRAKSAAALKQQLEAGQSPPRSWNAEVLAIGEGIATDQVQEVTEWSVVYTKELLEN